MENTFTPVQGWSVYKTNVATGGDELGPLVLCSDGDSCYLNIKGEVISMDPNDGHYIHRT